MEKTSCAVALAMALGALTMAVAPSPVGAAERTQRVRHAVAAKAIGPRALVNTLGLRAARRSTTTQAAGRYVTTAAGQRRVQAREPANQLFAEFGVFRDVRKRFRLLGADGAWLTVRYDRRGKQYQVGTWARRWAAAWSFALKRPASLGVDVNSELIAAGIDSAQVVCVLAYTPRGKAAGLLTVSEPGGLLLVDKNARAAACGTSVSSLFISDSVPRGTAPQELVKGVPIDPITYVRYVAPDRPALTLNADRRRMARNEVIEYFDKLLAYNSQTHLEVVDAVHSTALQLLTQSYVIPQEEAAGINLEAFFVDQVSYGLDMIPIYGPIASGVIKATYDTIELGGALHNNAHLEGPRVVECITNEVLRTAGDVKREYDDAFLHFARNIEALRDMILEGCVEGRRCASDRRLAAWWRSDPTKDITEETRALTRAHEVKAHELAIWRRLLPIRGRLHAPAAFQYMPPRADHTLWDPNCWPGYPYNMPFRNEDVLATYVSRASADPTWGVPLVTTGLFLPYHAWYDADWCPNNIARPYQQSWVLVLADNDAAAVTPVRDLARLFDPWDPERPATSGFGLSRREVACGWLNKRRIGYTGRAGYYFNPCHEAFYGVDGGVVSPYQSEDVHYAEAVPNAVAYWTPDGTEIAAGRPIADPDVVAPWIPHLTFGSCAALQSGAVRSVPGGSAVKVYFTNLYDGAINVSWIQPDGSTTFALTLPRQDQLARPLAAGSNTGQFRLQYSGLVDTTAGTSFLVTRASDGACIGTWAAREQPAGAFVDYAVAEVHGSNGILLGH